MLRSSNTLIALIVGFASVAIVACGGDTTELDDGNGGSGGQVLDSSTADGTADAETEAAADAEADASEDVSLDQSVEAETSVVDAEVLEGSLFDLSMPDVLLNEGGATLQGCYDCAVSTCSSEMAECEEDDGCRTILLCLFDEQCFGGPGGIDQSCAGGCALKAGVTDFSDPAIPIAYAAGQCIGGGCEDACGLVDGGLPFDASMDGF